MVKSLCWHVPQKNTWCLPVHSSSFLVKSWFFFRKKTSFFQMKSQLFFRLNMFYGVFLLKAKVHFFVAWIVAILEANPNLSCLNPLFICRQNHLLFLFTSTVLAVNNLIFAIIQFHFPTKKTFFHGSPVTSSPAWRARALHCVFAAPATRRARAECPGSWLLAVGGWWGLMLLRVGGDTLCRMHCQS